MNEEILGRNGFAMIYITDQWYEIFCFKSCALDIEDEEIEKTTPTSGRDREYTTGLTSGIFSVSGVTTSGNTVNTISPLYLLQNRNAEHRLAMSLTDQAGLNKSIEFNGIIRRTNITSDVTQWSQCSIEFRISGSPDLGEIEDGPSPSNVLSDYWNTTPGATSVTGLSIEHGYNLIGKTLIGVYREGWEYDIVTTAPGNRQARYVDPAVHFQTAFNSGETVFLIFR